MKLFLSLVFSLGIVTSLFAEEFEAETYCQSADIQTYPWYEVGVGPYNDNEMELIVVKHRSSLGGEVIELIKRAEVSEVGLQYVNDWETVKLMRYSEHDNEKANLFVLRDGPGGINEQGMWCYSNKTIRWQVDSTGMQF